MLERDSRKESRRDLVTEGKAKLSLCPVRLGLRIKLTQTDEQEKGIQIFTCTREPSYENEDPPPPKKLAKPKYIYTKLNKERQL